jgi:hypothetical protein
VPATQSRPFRLGVLIWNQYTDWPAFRDIGAKAERIRAYQAVGFSNVVYHLAPPYDHETLERFVAEVKPLVA